MKADLFSSKRRISPGPAIKRRKLKRSGNELFGMPYRTAMSLVYGAGFLLGIFIFCSVGMYWCPTATRGDPSQMDCTYSFGGFGVIVLLCGAMIIASAAFIGNYEETWHRLGILAVAAGFLISGMWALAIHKIEIHPDHFVVRGAFNPIARTYSLQDGNKVITRQHERKSDWNWGIRRRYIRVTVHLVRPDGSEFLLSWGRCTPHTWSRAAPHLVRGTKIDIPRGVH